MVSFNSASQHQAWNLRDFYEFSKHVFMNEKKKKHVFGGFKIIIHKQKDKLVSG